MRSVGARLLQQRRSGLFHAGLAVAARDRDHKRLRLPRQSLPRRLLSAASGSATTTWGTPRSSAAESDCAENRRRAMLDRSRNEAVAVGRLATDRHEKLARLDLRLSIAAPGKIGGSAPPTTTPPVAAGNSSLENMPPPLRFLLAGLCVAHEVLFSKTSRPSSTPVT